MLQCLKVSRLRLKPGYSLARPLKGRQNIRVSRVSPVAGGFACCQEIAIEVSDPRPGKVGQIVSGKEVDLVIEVKYGVIDGRCREQNHLFTRTI